METPISKVAAGPNSHQAGPENNCWTQHLIGVRRELLQHQVREVREQTRESEYNGEALSQHLKAIETELEDTFRPAVRRGAIPGPNLTVDTTT